MGLLDTFYSTKGPLGVWTPVVVVRLACVPAPVKQQQFGVAPLPAQGCLCRPELVSVPYSGCILRRCC